MMIPDVNIQLLDFPNSGKEMVVKNEDDSYTILINARLSHDGRVAAYNHAMKHINNGDFDRDCGDVQEIEAAAHEDVIIEVVPESAPAVPDPVVTVAERLKRPRRRRKRHQSRVQDRYVTQDRAGFIAEYCDAFALAENRWLYGNDL